MTSTGAAPGATSETNAGAAHLGSFLAAAGIDRTELEAFILRQYPAGSKLFFVSTVVQGLAGSTSDIDVIVVAGDEALGSAPMSTMMFREGRRIGVKAYGEQAVSEALRLVQVEADAAEDQQQDKAHALDRLGRCLPMLWVDLERLVGGVGDGVNPYAEHRSMMGKVVAKDARGRMIERWALARIAALAGQNGACLSYCTETIAAVQTCLLADAGPFNSNAKWTFQQWAQWRDQGYSHVGPAYGLVDAAYQRAMIATPSEAADLLNLVGTVVTGLIETWGETLSCTLEISADARGGPFVSGARYFERDGVFAVVDEALATSLSAGTQIDALTETAAAAVLQLAQRGLIRIRRNQQESHAHA